MKTWSCKIGEVSAEHLPDGADNPMRKAVSAAYKEICGHEPGFIFSGWGAELDESERAFVENREPDEKHYREWHLRKAAPDLLRALEGWQQLHSDMIAYGGDHQELSDLVVSEFAETQWKLMEATRTAIAKAKGGEA